MQTCQHLTNLVTEVRLLGLHSHGSCTMCLTQSMCRCAASLALEASDDMYMVIAFFDEVGFAKQHRNYRMRPQTLGVVLVSYCSAGDGGERRTKSAYQALAWADCCQILTWQCCSTLFVCHCQ